MVSVLKRCDCTCAKTAFFHSLIVSGSDDLNAIVWDPLRRQMKCCIKTGHSGNIFSAKVDHNIIAILFTFFL